MYFQPTNGIMCVPEQKNTQGLGLIDDIISLVAEVLGLVNSLIGGGGPKSVWSSWDQATKQAFIRQSIIEAVKAVERGEYNSVEEVMKQIIAKVYTEGHSWETWKRDNPTETQWIYDAENQVKVGTFNLGLGNMGGYLMWGFALTVAGMIIVPKLKPIVLSKKDSATAKINPVTMEQ